MKPFILATIALMSAPVLAEQPNRVPNTKNNLIGTTSTERRLALEEMRGRAQLETLIDQIVEEEDLIETHAWGYDRTAPTGRSR
jgi:hypothetical protein